MPSFSFKLPKAGKKVTSPNFFPKGFDSSEPAEIRNSNSRDRYYSQEARWNGTVACRDRIFSQRIHRSQNSRLSSFGVADGGHPTRIIARRNFSSDRCHVAF